MAQIQQHRAPKPVRCACRSQYMSPFQRQLFRAYCEGDSIKRQPLLDIISGDLILPILAICILGCVDISFQPYESADKV